MLTFIFRRLKLAYNAFRLLCHESLWRTLAGNRSFGWLCGNSSLITRTEHSWKRSLTGHQGLYLRRRWASVKSVILLPCFVDTGIQEAADGSILASAPRARNTSGRKDRSAGQEKLGRYEPTAAKYPRFHRRYATLAQTSQFHKKYGLDPAAGTPTSYSGGPGFTAPRWAIPIVVSVV